MTPVQMEVALHFYYMAEPDVTIFARSTATAEATSLLLRRGLLAITRDSRYAKTAALDVYVEALQAVPLPVMKWVMP